MATEIQQQLSDLLNQGLIQLNLDLPPDSRHNILEYLNLLEKWNKAYNLTAIRDLREMMVKHVFDSLAIVPHICGPKILDFGTGAGIPGIPLALALPNYEFYLLDSNNKKITFLRHVVLSLRLKNVQLVQKRIEDFHFEHGFANIVTRATLDLSELIAKTKHLLSKDGELLVMKGKYPEEELRVIKQKFVVERLHVPELDAERCIVKIVKN